MVKTEQKIQSQQPKAMSSSSSATSASSSSCRKKKYKGVRMRSWGSWVSEIRAPNQKTRIWLGSYSTPEAAARAYDAALLCLKGTSANLNFPITPSHFIPDTIMSPKSIQRVAAAAANNFLDTATTPPSPNPPSSSSSISSPSMSSSPSDQVDDDVSLVPSFETDTTCEAYKLSFESYTTGEANEPTFTIAPWLYEYNFDGLQSPKFTDHMFSGASLNPPVIEDFNEDGDIPLWSFC